VAASFELTGGAHADAVAVQQHAQQGLGVVGGVAVVAVGPVDGARSGWSTTSRMNQARWPALLNVDCLLVPTFEATLLAGERQARRSSR